jgi:phosphoglucomutase
VEQILLDHWAEFGRNVYSRHDYEALPTDVANGIMDQVRGALPCCQAGASATTR